jgi:hypothetical protein
MRAYDLMQTNDSIRNDLFDDSDKITQLRKKIWLLEFPANAQYRP